MTVLLMTTTYAAGEVPTAFVNYFRKGSERLQAVPGRGVGASAPDDVAGPGH
jgi:hypothetical protein